MPEYLIPLVVMYAVPAVRLGLFFIPPFRSSALGILNALIGRYEWLFRGFRDSVLLAVLIFLSAKNAYFWRFEEAAYFAPFILLSFFSMIRCKFHSRKMMQFAIDNPFLHPAKFFECYYSGFGILPIKQASFLGEKIISHSCSFKNGAKSKLKFWPVIIALLNTFSLARMVEKARRWKGPLFCRAVASAAQSIWGGRIAYLAKMGVKAEGLEKLSKLSGKFIFVFDHKSSLDFAIAPFALMCAHSIDRPSFALKYMAARDHFLDNIFLYNLLGKAMASVGTIFVDRKSKKVSPVASAEEAVSELVNLPIDIGIFPQGTRAYGNLNAEGKRLDAGYYTAGNKERLQKDNAHLKKGASFIAVSAAIERWCLEKPYVHIVPVGILGTATAMPKNGILLQTGADISIKIGDIITLSKNDVKNIAKGSVEYLKLVEDVNKRIDNAFINVLGINAELEHRFFTDIRKILPVTELEHLTVAMKQWRNGDNLIYSLLDCIYAVKPRYWQACLRELSHLIISQSPRESLLQFKGRVVDCLIERR